YIGDYTMKIRLSLMALTIFVAGCSGDDPEQSLKKQEEYKSELENLLQTEQVRNQQLQLHLDNLEEEIINFEEDKDNQNVQKYVTIVSDYASSLSEELNTLNDYILNYRNGDEVKTGDVVKVRDSISETIETFDASVSELELTEVLSREHENLVNSNSLTDKAVVDIADAIAADDEELLDEAIQQLQQATEYL